MGQYKVLERSYINERVVEPGEIVEYDGIASSNLEALDGGQSSAKARKALRAEAKKLNATVEVKGEDGAPSTFRPINDDDSDEVVAAAIAIAKQNRTD